MDTRMIVFTLLCVTGLVLVTGQGYGGRGDDGRGGGGGGDGGRGGGGFLGGRRGGGRGGGGRGGGRCGPVCKIFCEHGNVPDANGCPTCRCNPPPILTCRNGEWNGIRCNPNLPNTRCGLGASCETTNSGKGICCSYPRPKIQCPIGSQRTAQTCSPMLPNNNQCRGKHDFCQGGPADGGVCCRPNVRPETCPPPSARFGICVVGPNHCTNDNQCGVNQKCCSEGCGRECKYVGNQYPPIPPNPTY